MGYSITAEVYRTNHNVFFHVVEKTAWKHADGRTWGEVSGTHVLTFGGSGNSGSLRFVSDTGENFIITLRADGYKYYSDYHKDREKQREAHLTNYSVPGLEGRKFSCAYTAAEGNNLNVKITIG